MVKETEYTFVTIDNDNNENELNGAVVIDIDQDGDLLAAVTIDGDADMSDIITLSDDTIMLGTDMDDIISSDIDDTDISIIL